MTIRLGIVMDPIQDIHFKKDSSLAMLHAAQKRGWEIEYMELPDLYLAGGQARAHTRGLTVHMDPDNWYSFGASQDRALGDLDVILMRQDPPVDREFLMATYILESAERQGALVVNPAAGKATEVITMEAIEAVVVAGMQQVKAVLQRLLQGPPHA